MIKDDHQYQVTTDQHNILAQALNKLEQLPETDDIRHLLQKQRAGIKLMILNLESALHEYEERKKGGERSTVDQNDG